MTQPPWSTQNDLAEKVRAGAVDLLNQQLADALALVLQAKQAQAAARGRAGRRAGAVRRPLPFFAQNGSAVKRSRA